MNEFKVMISHTANGFIMRLFICLILVLVAPFPLYAGQFMEAVVGRVLDGDTFVLESSDKVRLVGLDAPETGEAFSSEARRRLAELTLGKTVELEICSERDKYGRVLAVVRIGGKNVNLILVEEGLALPMLIPPCGRIVAKEILETAAAALESKKGVYTLEDYVLVDQDEAGSLLERRAVVRGKILSLHKGESAWHFNFGKDYREDFTAVLFTRDLSRFYSVGIDPEDLIGREVLVIGKVKGYNGPEIIIKGPEQLMPVD